MNPNNIVLYESEYTRLKSILVRMQRDLRVDLALLIDRNGQQIAVEGEAADIDLTSLASLAAANQAATDGLAQLVGEPGFNVLYHQGRHRNIHISSVSKRFSLVVVFNETIPLGLVRLRVRHATAYLEEIFRLFSKKTERDTRPAIPQAVGSSPLDFTDEELDKLFGS